MDDLEEGDLSRAQDDEDDDDGNMQEGDGSLEYFMHHRHAAAFALAGGGSGVGAASAASALAAAAADHQRSNPSREELLGLHRAIGIVASGGSGGGSSSSNLASLGIAYAAFFRDGLWKVDRRLGGSDWGDGRGISTHDCSGCPQRHRKLCIQ